MYPSRRDFLRSTAVTAGGLLLSGCAALKQDQPAEPVPKSGGGGGPTQVDALARYAAPALLDGDVTPAELDPQRIARPDVQRLLKRVLRQPAMQ